MSPRPTKLHVEALEQREVPAAMSIGMNLEHISDDMAGWMFTDVFKVSRPWEPYVRNMTTGKVSLDFDHLFPLDLDKKGWPLHLNETTNSAGEVLRQQLDTDMLDRLNGRFPRGTYTAQWDGNGTITWTGDVKVKKTGMTPDGHHYALLSVKPAKLGIHMRISAMSSDDPIRDIHVWMPDYKRQHFAGQIWKPGAAFSPFHPLFLARLAPFHTLRFMQLSEANTSQVQNWSDRRPYDFATQMTGDQSHFQNGIAPEYLIELCNELNADAWFNMPHMADDDYVRNFATTVRDQLEAGRTIEVEWSNEVWNGSSGLAPNQWIKQQLTLPENQELTFEQFVAAQQRRVFGIWSEVFAGQSDRVIRVVAGHQDDPGYTGRLLDNMNGEFDAVSCAAYFGPDKVIRSKYTKSTGVGQIVADTKRSIPEYLAFLSQHHQITHQYSEALNRPIKFVAYEGGPSLEGHYEAYQTAMNKASVDSRMYGIYRKFLQGANSAGLDLLVNYEFTGRNQYTGDGIYGALNYMTQSLGSAAKYHALYAAATGLLYPLEPKLNLPLLKVNANPNSCFREFADSWRAIESAGLAVQLAAATAQTLAIVSCPSPSGHEKYPGAEADFRLESR